MAANVGGRKGPLVFFHTWFTEEDDVPALADAFGPDQPIYAVRPPVQADGGLPTRTGQWVEYHYERLMALAVGEPYLLAGFSFGGVVALEIARRLEREGHEVGYVGLIDTTRPRLEPQQLRKFVRYHAAELADMQREERRDYFHWALSKLKQEYRMRYRKTLVRLHLRRRAPRSLADRKNFSRATRAIHRAYLNYEAMRYDHPVALFYTHDSYVRTHNDPTLRWARFLRGGLDVYALDGKHFEIFGEQHRYANVAKIAMSIEQATARRALDRAPAPLTSLSATD